MQLGKMKRVCLVLLVFETIFVVLSNGEVTYYVATSKSISTCPGQPCKKLLDYINNAEEFFNQEESITMKFSTGIHYVDCFERDTTTISTPRIAMVGEGSHATRVYCMNVHFNNTVKLYISQLEMSVWTLTVTPASSKLQAVIDRHIQTELWILSVKMDRGASSVAVSDLTSVHIQNTTGTNHTLVVRGPSTKTVKLSKCMFRDGIRTTFSNMKEANVTVRDCVFVNNPVFVYDTRIVLAGTSVFMGSRVCQFLAQW